MRGYWQNSTQPAFRRQQVAVARLAEAEMDARKAEPPFVGASKAEALLDGKTKLIFELSASCSRASLALQRK